MRILKNILKNATHILFLDIEGTQRAHEVIEVGAVLVRLKDDYRIDDSYKPQEYKRFCLAHEPIGRIVTKMTGLTEEQINSDGVMFIEALRELNKLIGALGDNLIVATFGNQDILMLEKSAEFYKNDTFVQSFVSYLGHKNWDYSAFMNSYIRNEHNQACSLLKLLEIFKVEPYKNSHDALNDAIDLFNLYKKMLDSKEVLAENYLETLKNNTSLLKNNDIVLNQMKKLINKKDISYETFYQELLNYFA